MTKSSSTGKILRNTCAVATLVASAVTASGLPVPAHAASAHGVESIAAAPVFYRSVKIQNLDIFYREAGPKNAPTVLLLHGFPSSSHMFRDLIPLLADKYHVIAPDYPGFGYSAQPGANEFSYNFKDTAALIDELTQTLGVKSYVMYMQDYGGPVGFRLAVAHPERVRGIIVQNAVASVDGWNPDVVAKFQPFWQGRNAETEKPIREFLAAPTTKWQYTQGEANADRISPDSYTHDQIGLDRTGNDAAQLSYLFNYQDNVGQYPAWQNYLKTHKPPVLVVWGKNDPFFTLKGAELFKTLDPKTQSHFYDAGHFALETHLFEISNEIHAFLSRNAR